MKTSINTIKENIARAGAELLRACKEGEAELAAELVSLGMSVDYQAGSVEETGTPLIVAVKSGHLRVVEEMLRLGANPNILDFNGRTALMHAAMRFPEAIGALAGAGAGLNNADKLGQTALMHATSSESGDAIEQLIARGADLNARSTNGMTALCKACGSLGKKSAALMLVNSGSDLELGSKQGMTPLLLSALGGDHELVAFLLDAGANAQAEGTLLSGADECGRNVYAHGVTALMMAALSGSLETVELLLSAGLDPQKRASTGRAAADFARVSRHVDIEAMFAAHQEKRELSLLAGIGPSSAKSRGPRI